MAVTQKTVAHWLALLTYGVRAGILVEPGGHLVPLGPETSSWRQQCFRIAERGREAR
jgi:hypothetical protein